MHPDEHCSQPKFDEFRRRLKERLREARENGTDTGRSEIRDRSGEVIGVAEEVTSAQARFDSVPRPGGGHESRIRSPRQDEIDAMDEQTLEEELAICMSRLVC